ncbi:2'-N-acetylparomamine deacetylase [Methylobacterium crusticola]|uniref:2'-N-acetylparomamine deacetylase n=1 Tax=Methylobacterium crusticola TaxID=1697972 RepID=A0ABQ4QQN4_9HYPH|nr:PIG-L family deacetylase [Methylobacterium crusticola]GJD47603.1 2'-N-acetylparomamine deacetylase [Methylobacterium crusticola]
MPTALALSPHLDDAAFSCGGTLAQLAASGWRVVMATLLTATVPDPTGFALACQRDKGLGPEVDYMALRRDEDRAAAAHLGVAPVHVALPEAPHRGYASAPELFGATRPDDGIADDLAALLRRLLADAAPRLVLAPQAVGGHVDHVQVVRALRAVPPACPVLWWRDYPYTVRHPDPQEPFGAAFAALPEVTVRLSPGEAAAKEAACAAYASQIGFQFGGAAGLAARLAAEEGRERFRLEGAGPELAESLRLA